MSTGRKACLWNRCRNVTKICCCDHHSCAKFKDFQNQKLKNVAIWSFQIENPSLQDRSKGGLDSQEAATSIQSPFQYVRGTQSSIHSPDTKLKRSYFVYCIAHSILQARTARVHYCPSLLDIFMERHGIRSQSVIYRLELPYIPESCKRVSRAISFPWLVSLSACCISV